MTMQDTMLGYARDSILARAASDGYRPDEYVAESDDEGYLTSLLIAFRHWCHVHDIDWNDEVNRAQERFEEDLEELWNTQAMTNSADL